MVQSLDWKHKSWTSRLRHLPKFNNFCAFGGETKARRRLARSCLKILLVFLPALGRAILRCQVSCATLRDEALRYQLIQIWQALKMQEIYIASQIFHQSMWWIAHMGFFGSTLAGPGLLLFYVRWISNSIIFSGISHWLAPRGWLKTRRRMARERREV